MNNAPKISEYKTFSGLVRKLRSDISGVDCILLYAYNRTGKTRLSMGFKDEGKRKNNGNADTLYFNAFTEDLFVWENDLDGDSDRFLRFNDKSKFFDGLKGLALDENIEEYLNRYTDIKFDIDYTKSTVVFSRDVVEKVRGNLKRKTKANIKISRGEENIFIWCFFLAICERVLDDSASYEWVKYLYIDDPISSLDDDNAIAVACDLADLLRRAASRQNEAGDDDPVRIVFSSHHSLFFNVMCNELGRRKEGQPTIKSKRYFLHRSNGDDVYTLRATDDTPFFHHVATLAELQKAVDSGNLYTHHFNALRTILEKTASFFGHKNITFCLNDLDDEILYNRALNLLSHGKYSIFDPVEMVDDNKKLFGRILHDFVDRFQFDLPEILATTPQTNSSS